MYIRELSLQKFDLFNSNQMRKIFLLLVLFSIDAIVFSQGISVRFIGRINVTNYCRLDSVSITNITRNWTETIVYPDTIIVLGGTGNVNLNIAEEQGLGQNIPNPFDCDTRVNLSVSQREDVRMQLLDISGKLYANYSGTLDAGVHAFDISAATTQTYILNATIGNRSYSIRMVNTGSGCGSSIKYAGISDGIISKQTWDNEFQIGDNMRYIGYTYIDGNILESEPVLQSLRESQDIVLAFRLGSIGSLNGHDWVDLGLPSGTCWATCNVGSDTPEGYGNYYAWGETTTKTTYDWNTYRYCNGSYNTLTKYCDNPSDGYNGFTDSLSILQASDDAVTANWGAGWRIPMHTEMNELINNCIVIWTTQNGVNGYLFTGPNGNSIFLPVTGGRYDSIINYASSHGYYWSSSILTGSPSNVWFLRFNSDNYDMGFNYRYYGLSVRPVCLNGSSELFTPVTFTGQASNITDTDATLSGNVALDGGLTVTERGFLYGTNSNNLTRTEQSGSGIGDFTANLTGLTSGTIYYYKTYATNSAGTAVGEVRSFVTASTSYSEPTGYVNGYGYVDLGLPSGTKWATCNVGAIIPEGYGDYFAWGETTTKENYNMGTYRYCNGDYNNLTKYCSNAEYGNNGFTDVHTTLEASDDAATANWGSGWRMPTQTEMNELKNNCTVTWTPQNGVNGYLFTGPNGNSIFFPAAGHRFGSGLSATSSYGSYWSSSLNTSLPFQAWSLSFSSDTYYESNDSRSCGLSVRAVCNQ